MRTRVSRSIRIVVAGIALVGCAPSVDGPVARQRATDHADEAQLGRQLQAVPGVRTAHATLRRAVADPLAATAPTPATAAVLLVVDDGADHDAIRATATALTRALAPDTMPSVILAPGAARPTLARVGPFTVEAASRGPLRAALALALLAIAGLAGWVARREWQRARAR